MKQIQTHPCELKLPVGKKTFFNLIEASAIGVGTVLVQIDDKDQMQEVSQNCRVITESAKNLQKFFVVV